MDGGGRGNKEMSGGGQGERSQLPRLIKKKDSFNSQSGITVVCVLLVSFPGSLALERENSNCKGRETLIFFLL